MSTATNAAAPRHTVTVTMTAAGRAAQLARINAYGYDADEMADALARLDSDYTVGDAAPYSDHKTAALAAKGLRRAQRDYPLCAVTVVT